MGLACEHFHFSTGAPSFDLIYRAICQVEETDVPATIKRFPSQPPNPNSSPDAASRCFADGSLELYGREKTDLEIHISLDGQNVYVIGNAKGLLRSSSLALEKLGGTIVKPEATGVRPRTPPREWPWFLVVLFFGLLATLCIGLPLVIFVLFRVIPIEFGSRLRDRWREKRLRRHLVSLGRVLTASQLDAKLASGEGTLIIEHLLPMGFLREWWTEDDVIGRSTVPLPTSPLLLPEGMDSTLLHAYAIWCMWKYTDPATGTAKLTDTVPQLAASHRKLSEQYPNAKIAVLFCFDWGARHSIIYRSGHETDGEDRREA
jgi:hypothetical protein